MKKALLFIPVILFVTGLIFLGCQTEVNGPSDSIDKARISSENTCENLAPTTLGIIPTLVIGNTPAETQYNVKFDPPTPGTYPLGNGFITFAITNGDCGEVMNWSVSGPIQINYVYMKGGSNYLSYNYTDLIPRPTSDGNLHCPLTGGSGTYADVSHLNFVWSPLGQNCFTETAWAAGTKYVAKGNWATYTPYAEGTVNLYAGQSHLAGEVEFSAVINGYVTITIDLADGWELQNVDEPVKIQDYATAPSGNPSPGLFAHKGSSLVVVVPANNFYGIHLDVAYCE
jgi:hypothetical protein